MGKNRRAALNARLRLELLENRAVPAVIGGVDVGVVDRDDYGAIVGGTSNDDATLGYSYANSSTRLWVEGGWGGDNLFGANGSDVIIADKGNLGNNNADPDTDELLSIRTTAPATGAGRQGFDKLVGNLGDDLIFGAGGTDKIYGDLENESGAAITVADVTKAEVLAGPLVDATPNNGKNENTFTDSDVKLSGFYSVNGGAYKQTGVLVAGIPGNGDGVNGIGVGGYNGADQNWGDGSRSLDNIGADEMIRADLLNGKVAATGKFDVIVKGTTAGNSARFTVKLFNDNAQVNAVDFTGLTNGAFSLDFSTNEQPFDRAELYVQDDNGQGGNDQARVYIQSVKLETFDEGIVGNDTAIAFGGHDSIFGGVGNDILVGGVGNDLLNGGTGTDTAQWNDLSFEGTGSHVAGVVLNLSSTLVRYESGLRRGSSAVFVGATKISEADNDPVGAIGWGGNQVQDVAPSTARHKSVNNWLGNVDSISAVEKFVGTSQNNDVAVLPNGFTANGTTVDGFAKYTKGGVTYSFKSFETIVVL